MNIILNAARIAAHYHKDQKRDSNGKPYMTHLVRVAGRTATHPDSSEEDVAAAFLHDIDEDIGQMGPPELRDEIRDRVLSECGLAVWETVMMLTNQSTGSPLPRLERKRIDREKLKVCPRNVKVIKLYDRIDNIEEFTNDAKLRLETRYDFMLKYCDESMLLLNEALRGADDALADALAMELYVAIQNLRLVCSNGKADGLPRPA